MNRKTTIRVFFVALSVAALFSMSAAAQEADKVRAAFSKIKEKDASEFRLRVPEISKIKGRGAKHMQGIQFLPSGGWAVSGSGNQFAYVFLTDPLGELCSLCPLPSYHPENDSLAAKGWEGYNHAGGFQISRSGLLAVGLERIADKKKSNSRIVFFDVNNPALPIYLPNLTIIRDYNSTNGDVMTAGAVGITDLRDGSILTAVANWDSKRLDFYHGTRNNKFNFLASWEASDDFKAYQNINLYGFDKDKLVLIGMHSQSRKYDWGDLFDVSISNDEKITVTKTDKKHFVRSGKGPRFVHGSGSYMTQERSPRLLVYSVESNVNDGQVRCNRWGGEEPLNEEYWVKLYEDDNFKKRSLTFYFADQEGNFNNRNFGDKASSVKYNIPVGYNFVLYDDKEFKDRTIELRGSGTIENLKDKPYKFGDKASSGRWLPDQ